MPDPSYVIEMQGRRGGLQFHLDSAFYPPLPMEIKHAFIQAFEDYWDFEIDINELKQRLRDDAGYQGDLGSYNFWQFLNEEDIES